MPALSCGVSAESINQRASTISWEICQFTLPYLVSRTHGRARHGGMRYEAGQVRREGWINAVRPSRRAPRLKFMGGAPQDEAFFLMPSIIYPHAEERPGDSGARLEARTAPMQRLLAQPLRCSTRRSLISLQRQSRKRNWPNPKVRPSLNREASRLGDVRVRRPSFRAQVPETRSGLPAPKTLGELGIARDGISRITRLITNGNSVWLVCKNRNAVAGPQTTRVNSPQPGFSSIGPRLLCATENRETH